MDAADRAEMAAEYRRMEALITARTRNIPSRWPAPPAPYQTLEIIGGNTLTSGQAGILHALGATPAAVYDPELDTTYPDGLGRAWLFIDGVRQSTRVLVWHQYTGYPYAFLVGRRLRVSGTQSLTAAAQTTPPASPRTGQKVLVGTGATGAFAGHDGEIATWNGSSYDFSSASGVALGATYYLPIAA